MAGSVGINAKIYADLTAAGTATVGTATLTLMTTRNSWSFSQERPMYDTTEFLATSQSQVPGLPAATGDVNGFFTSAATAYFVLGTATAERGLVIVPDSVNYPTVGISGKAFFSNKAAGAVTSAISFDMSFSAGGTGIAWATV